MKEYLYSLIQNIIYPDGRLVLGLFFLMVIDLITGVHKSSKKRIATSSNGFRMTINKGTMYFSFLSAVFVIANVAKPGVPNTGIVNTALDNLLNVILLMSMYIEFKSILENIIEAHPSNDVVKYLVKPLHNVLILKLKGYAPKL